MFRPFVPSRVVERTVVVLCMVVICLPGCQSKPQEVPPGLLEGLALFVDEGVVNYRRPAPFSSTQLAQLVAAFEHLADNGRIPRTFILSRSDEPPYDDLTCALTERGFEINELGDMEGDVRAGKCVLGTYFEEARVDTSYPRRQQRLHKPALPTLTITRTMEIERGFSRSEGWQLFMTANPGGWSIREVHGFELMNAGKE